MSLVLLDSGDLFKSVMIFLVNKIFAVWIFESEKHKILILQTYVIFLNFSQ